MNKMLRDLCEGITGDNIPDTIVTGLKQDSRLIQSGDVFLAFAGFMNDGRQHISSAVNNGAVACLYDPDGFTLGTEPDMIPMVAIPSLHKKLGLIASRFYDNPSNSLHITGVTGTNGKTTIAYLLTQAYVALDKTARYIGTLGEGALDNLKPLMNTTPDVLVFNQLMHQYRSEHVDVVNAEISSHALVLNRIDNIDISSAIYTNLSHDHLDFHHTMDEYAAAKALLFSRHTLKQMVLNADCPYVEIMINAANPNAKMVTYGLTKKADCYAASFEISVDGIRFEYVSPFGRFSAHSMLLGKFNLYNLLAIITHLLVEGYLISDIQSIIPRLKPCVGRMEIVCQKPYVVIDYAHTPDALLNVLKTLKPLTKGQLFVLFGCGGDRDKAKRSVMGEIASLFADTIILTSDNPRYEEPNAIIEDIKKGIADTIVCETIESRQDAIFKAISMCSKDDVLLIAGKGHEQYQQIGAVRYPFSDRKIVEEGMQMYGY
jgi:UDP-N-acetylmuramoyl-L-alanyl-D-glutamate--2,6-diaminopimelate ligase